MFPGNNDDIRARSRAARQREPCLSRASSARASPRCGAVTQSRTITSRPRSRSSSSRWCSPTLRSTAMPAERRNALSDGQKNAVRVLFFGRAGCVACHQVSGRSNEMFSDFREHVIAVPQVAPSVGNVPFDGPGANEDFGLEQVTGSPADRYAFRTSPLRNVALQSSFMHNGASSDWKTRSATIWTRPRRREATRPAASRRTSKAGRADRTRARAPRPAAANSGCALRRGGRRPRRLRAQRSPRSGRAARAPEAPGPENAPERADAVHVPVPLRRERMRRG